MWEGAYSQIIWVIFLRIELVLDWRIQIQKYRLVRDICGKQQLYEFVQLGPYLSASWHMYRRASSFKLSQNF